MSDPAPATLLGYPVRLRRIHIAGLEYHLLGPGNFEALVDDPRVVQRFERDEYLPYWAEFWPACLLLADAVADWPAITSHASPIVLELGCGLGLASLVAVHRGYRVIASDYEQDALTFVTHSAELSNLRPPETRCIDWRSPVPNLCADRIIAAEVLYEPRNLEPMARFIAAHLASDGFALVCDGNRSTADDFPPLARAAGLVVDQRSVERTAREDAPPVRGRLFTVRHAYAARRSSARDAQGRVTRP
jgi:SAM-dependent methyltransferase